MLHTPLPDASEQRINISYPNALAKVLDDRYEGYEVFEVPEVM